MGIVDLSTMAINHIDAKALHSWAKRSVAELSLRRAELNQLNVFPVPDADTGSNMAHTMEAAVAEADKGGDVAEALAVGSVRGARGNSGMVLSQVLRAVADSSADSLIDSHTLVNALKLAVELVDRAIATPVEGTVVSVLKAAAEAAEEAFEHSDALVDVVKTTCDEAVKALANTPSQLKVLRDAGVVDAGGAGLVILLECLLAEVTESEQREGISIPETIFELEVVFFYRGDIDKLEAAISGLGDSLVIARASEQEANVHIHSPRAGEVIEKAFAAGAVSNLRLEVLPARGVQQEQLADASPKVFVATRDTEMAKLFASIGASLYSAGMTLGEDDIFVGKPGGLNLGDAQVVAVSSNVEAIAALSVYAPGPDAASTMAEVAGGMRVDKPSDETVGAIIACCNDLLQQGGEQLTILTSLTLDTDQLSRQLGVEVIVVNIPGLRTEIGVE